MKAIIKSLVLSLLILTAAFAGGSTDPNPAARRAALDAERPGDRDLGGESWNVDALDT